MSTQKKRSDRKPGRTPDKQLASLNQQVDQLYQQGQYEQAVPSALQACELTRQALGENHPDYAVSLNNLAVL